MLQVGTYITKQMIKQREEKKHEKDFCNSIDNRNFVCYGGGGLTLRLTKIKLNSALFDISRRMKLRTIRSLKL